MSADVCPVCGAMKKGDHEYVCGRDCYEGGEVCDNAERLAIERAAEIERLKAALKRIADQGPCYGPDGTSATWKHWREIARETLEAKP